MADKYLDEFNSTLKKLVRFTVSMSTTMKVADFFVGIDKRIVLMINESPITALEMVGPKLIKYAAQIKQRDIKFFLAANFDDDMDPDDKDGRKSITRIIEVVKKIYTTCAADDRERINDMIDDLLINYCGYLKASEPADA